MSLLHAELAPLVLAATNCTNIGYQFHSWCVCLQSWLCRRSRCVSGGLIRVTCCRGNKEKKTKKTKKKKINIVLYYSFSIYYSVKCTVSAFYTCGFMCNLQKYRSFIHKSSGYMVRNRVCIRVSQILDLLYYIFIICENSRFLVTAVRNRG